VAALRGWQPRRTTPPPSDADGNHQDPRPRSGDRTALCRALARSRPRPTHRQQRPRVHAPRPRRPPPRALTAPERATGARPVACGRALWISRPRRSTPPCSTRGTYHCSVRTMYRVLAAAHESASGGRRSATGTMPRPELLATRPNQLWSWDITRLKGPTTCPAYQTVVVLDVFSRYVVG